VEAQVGGCWRCTGAMPEAPPELPTVSRVRLSVLAELVEEAVISARA